jgi:hypothetical protein
MLADALCHRRTQLRTRSRRLDVGRQALLVVARLRRGETYAQSGLRVCDRHEITRFRPLLDQLGDLRDVVVTVDALYCQRNHVT